MVGCLLACFVLGRLGVLVIDVGNAENNRNTTREPANEYPLYCFHVCWNE